MEHKKTKRGYYEKRLNTSVITSSGTFRKVTGISKVSYEEACKDAERKKEEAERIERLKVINSTISTHEPFKNYMLMYMEYRRKESPTKHRWTESAYSANFSLYSSKYKDSKLGNMQLKSLNTKVFQVFFDDLTLTQGLSKKYVDNIRLLAIQTLDFINRNICSIENYAKVANLNILSHDEVPLGYLGDLDEKGQVLTESEILKLYNTIKEEPTRYRYGYCYLLQLATGCRPQEICALTKNCVNYEKETIRICKAIGLKKIEGKRRTPYMKTTKNRVVRELYMDDIIKECLEGIYKFMPRNMFEGYTTEYIDQGLLVYNSYGKFVDTDVYTSEFKRLCHYIGIDLHYGEGSYCLRHTYISYNNKSNNPIQILITAKNAGHSPKVDLETYTHVSEEQVRDNTKNPIQLAAATENSELINKSDNTEISTVQEDLKKCKEMYDAGLITEENFSKVQQKLLGI